MNLGTGMSLESYCDLVRALGSESYTVADFESFDPEKRHLLLRHDVDLSLSRAVEMAEAEAAIGVTSSYFVLLNTEMYNAHSASGRRALRRLTDLGHRIGLHLDHNGVADGDLAALDGVAKRECEALEDLVGSAVRAITFHRPAKWLLGLSVDIAGRRQGYHPRFFGPDRYCSDSEGRFRFHVPLEHPAVKDGRALHLATHPIWWCASNQEGPIDKLRRFRAEHAATFDNELAANCKPARELLGHAAAC
jgi:hypothetical protein